MSRMNRKEEDDWVAAALADDTLVAELLSSLSQSKSVSACPPPPPKNPFIRLPCVWGHRQRRSKASKESSGTRRSPTTPLSLSWSDGDYSNSTSSRPPSDLPRSTKGTYGDDAAASKVCSSSSRKKKSFAELKEEESLLMKERVGLKREVDSFNSSLKQHRVANERLKRIKTDLKSQTAGNTCTASYLSAPSYFPKQENKGSRQVHNDDEAGFFALPDLNMMPSEEEMVNATGMS